MTIKSGAEHLNGPYYNYATAFMHIVEPIVERARLKEEKTKPTVEKGGKLSALNQTFPGLTNELRSVQLDYKDLRIDEFNNCDAKRKYEILDELKAKYPFLANTNHTLIEFLEARKSLKKNEKSKLIPNGLHIYQIKPGSTTVVYLLLKNGQAFDLSKFPHLKSASLRQTQYQLCFADQSKTSADVNENVAQIFKDHGGGIKGEVVVIGTKHIHRLCDEDFEAYKKSEKRTVPLASFLSKQECEQMCVDDECLKRKKPNGNDKDFLMNLVQSAIGPCLKKD